MPIVRKAKGARGFMGGESATDYLKDGGSIELVALHSKIQVGQQVILFHVTWGYNHPLQGYTRPSVFIVNERPESNDLAGTLVLADDQGHKVTCTLGDASYLYDAVEWGLFQYERLTEMLRRKQAKVDQLGGQHQLLTDILVRQGVRVLTAEEAGALGL